MYLKLRVFFTILSALCLGFAVTAGAIWGYIWAIVLGLAALLFFMVMLIFKQSQEKQEQKANIGIGLSAFPPAHRCGLKPSYLCSG